MAARAVAGVAVRADAEDAPHTPVRAAPARTASNKTPAPKGEAAGVGGGRGLRLDTGPSDATKPVTDATELSDEEAEALLAEVETLNESNLPRMEVRLPNREGGMPISEACCLLW